MIRVVASVGLVLAVAVAAAGCSGPGAATAAPTQAPPTPTSGAPASTPTSPPPTTAPTAAPTEPPPTVEPTVATPRERVSFNWAPGSVAPSDADDVDIILMELRTHPGISGGAGDESVLNVFYDPTVITVEEIMAILQQMGHPVVINE